MRDDGTVLAIGATAALALLGVALGKGKRGSARRGGRIAGWTDDGEPILIRKKRFKGVSVNPMVPPPKPPGEWVDDEKCTICGAKYSNFRAGVGFDEAARELRNRAGGFEEGGGFRSRGPVLWMMRVLKLEKWFTEHMHPEIAEQRHFRQKQRKRKQKLKALTQQQERIRRQAQRLKYKAPQADADVPF